MPLSEHELRTLEQLEAQLSAEDPKFAHAMAHDPARRRRRQRALLVAVITLAGLGMVIAAAVLKQTWLGLAGALVIAAGALMSLQVPSATVRRDQSDLDGLYLQDGPASGGRPHLTPIRGGATGLAARRVVPGASRKPRVARPSRAGGTSPFMARLEERWERRRRDNQGW